MKAFLAIAVSMAALLAFRTGAYAQLDSAAASVLGDKLDQYMDIIELEPAEVKCGEADFLIESCRDSLTRQFTAIRLYSRYIGSRLMGDEAVAIHIFDTWFAPGKVRMQTETDYMNARIFAEFNRQSLIGMKAPELYLEDKDGGHADIFGEGYFSPRPAVIFFYDSGCPNCRMESIMLRNVLNDRKYSLDLYAVYTGQSEKEWSAFIEDYLDIDNPGIRTMHLYDPGLKSDFQMKYGVLQTPDMFLVSKDGIIIGRRLDSMALKQMLDIMYVPYEYGGEESSAFYDRVFSEYGRSPDCSDFKAVCDRIAGKTLGAGDTTAFRRMAGDMLYWAGAKRGEGCKCGLEYLIGRYIKGEPGVWTSRDDSLRILSYSDVLADMLGKAAAGQKLQKIKVPGTIMSAGRKRSAKVRLDRLRNTTLIFHTEGCGLCEAELAAADSVSAARPEMKFFIVDVDSVMDADPETAFRLFDAFDLSVMPYITVTDKKGRVIRKYVSLAGN